MKRQIQVGLIIALSMALIYIYGCNEQNKSAGNQEAKATNQEVKTAAVETTQAESQPVDSRQEKAVAAENIQLQKDLQQKDLQIEALKNELQAEKDKLAKCQADLKNARHQSAERMKPILQQMLSEKADTTKPLREENENLKKQIEDLQKQVEELKAVKK